MTPPPGEAIAYFDYRSQEYGVAAYLSGDLHMIADYTGGEVYLPLGVRSGLVPRGATKQTHGDIRDKVLKPVLLGLQYGAPAPGDRLGDRCRRPGHLPPGLGVSGTDLPSASTDTSRVLAVGGSCRAGCIPNRPDRDKHGLADARGRPRYSREGGRPLAGIRDKTSDAAELENAGGGRRYYAGSLR